MSEGTALATPRLHQSIAHLLVSRSPLHGWHKAFAEAPEEYTDATDRGQLCHALLLGGADIVTVEANDWRTNAAKGARDEARAAGKIPVLAHKLADAQILTERVKAELERRKILLTGQSELTLNWEIDGVACEGRLDHFIEDQGLILDFKICDNAALRACESKFYNFGYDIQHASYVQAIDKIHPYLAGRVKMLFVFVEADAPNAMRIMPVGGTMRTLGAWRWMRAVDIWRDCLEQYGIKTPWPAYSDDMTPAEAPTWALEEQKIMDVIHDGGNL